MTEKEIIMMRFGLFNGDRMSIDRITKKLGFGVEKYRVIKKRKKGS